MSLTPQTRRRLPTIKANLMKGLSYGQIGGILGVTEKTIDRDIKAWLESGDFETWVKEQWVELHQKVTKETPVEAYKQVSKLLAKMVTRKAEIKSEHKEEITTHKIEELNVTLNDYRNSVQKIVDRYIQQDSTQ